MTRRGVAMLLVLVTLVLAVAAAANVARVSATAMAEESAAAARRLADDLATQGEAAAAAWLARDSAEAVLPPDAPAPILTVLHDRVGADGLRAELTLTGVDLLGMPPVDALLDASALRRAVPVDVLAALRALEGGAGPFGPDQIDPGALARPVYPRAGGRPARSFGEHSPADSGNRDPDAREPALATLAAFTRPTLRARRGPAVADRPIVLNINTAPDRLLETAFEMAGIDALERVVRAREAGTQATLDLRVGEQAPIRFATRSTLWAFRVDARVGPVRRSWWCVFEQYAGAWRLVRRIGIDA